MAVLNQSETWPIHSARRLHDKAQQGFLWQLMLPDAIPRPNEDMMMTAVSCKLPGIEFTQKTYSVAGQEQYYLGGSKRGGPFDARFLEVEGGLIDRFFRIWANTIDIPLSVGGGVRLTRWRRARGFGAGILGHARTAIVKTLKRDGSTSTEFLVTRLQLLSYGGYDLNYEGAGPLVVSVRFTCDDVIRNVFA